MSKAFELSQFANGHSHNESTSTSTIGGSTVVISGNLQVDGTSTTLNTATLTVDDLNITVADGAANSAAADGGGITIDGANANFSWDDSNSRMNLNKALYVNAKGTFETTSENNVFTVGVTNQSSYDAKIQIAGARTLCNTCDISMLEFRNDTSSAYNMAQISGMDPSADHTLGNGILRFRTSTGGTLSDQMTIDQTGKVGIGTTVPNTRLSVESFGATGGDDTRVFELRNTSTNAYAADALTSYNAHTSYPIVNGATITFHARGGAAGNLITHSAGINNEPVVTDRIARLSGQNTGTALATKTYYAWDGAGTAISDMNVSTDQLLETVTATGLSGARYGLYASGDVFYTGALTLGITDISDAHINSPENMTFNIDTDNDDSGTRYFAWYANGSKATGTELMRLDERGNVGIGTQASNVLAGNNELHLYDSGSPKIIIESSTTSATTFPELNFVKKGSTANGVDLGVINWFGNDSAGNETRYAYIFAEGEATGSGGEAGRLFMTVPRSGSENIVYYEMRGVGGSDNPLNAHHEFRGTADGHIMHVRRDVVDRGNSGGVVAISLGENTGPEDDPWIDFYNYGSTGAGAEAQVNGSIGTINGNQGVHIWGYETLMLRSTTDSDMPSINSNAGTGLTINSTTSAFYGLLTCAGVTNFTSNTASTTTTTGSVVITGGLGVSGAINAGADVTAFASSDQRLKTNLQPIENSLDKVKTITGYTFNWNKLAEDKPQDQREAGVLAQDVEAVLPEVTTTRDDGYKAVRYEKMVPMLIEAIKELSDKVDAQQQELERLRKWQ